jgi:hypothetical protein
MMGIWLAHSIEADLTPEPSKALSSSDLSPITKKQSNAGGTRHFRAAHLHQLLDYSPKQSSNDDKDWPSAPYKKNLCPTTTRTSTRTSPRLSCSSCFPSSTSPRSSSSYSLSSALTTVCTSHNTASQAPTTSPSPIAPLSSSSPTSSSSPLLIFSFLPRHSTRLLESHLRRYKCILRFRREDMGRCGLCGRV